ncbi:hypothetical protein Pint_35972 [Pistacia integerrima]|uniref:Uncharacterized protein n=1 Tax=Pistacia integerrima TaxID=434235 RepID=A0ACC0Y349_9ROSI|nr:hypothetical protein Pint_35972 [Pistacia integerrima]
MSDHRLEQVENELGSLAAGQKKLQQAMKASEERLLKHMESMFAHFSTRSRGHDDYVESSRGPHRNLSKGGSLAPKITKLHFPRYNGMDDPTGWIQGTEEAEKLPIAGYHLDRDVQLCLACMTNEMEGTWNLKRLHPPWDIYPYPQHLLPELVPPPSREGIFPSIDEPLDETTIEEEAEEEISKISHAISGNAAP